MELFFGGSFKKDTGRFCTRRHPPHLAMVNDVTRRVTEEEHARVKRPGRL